MSLGNLVLKLRLIAESRELSQGLDNANRDLERFRQNISKSSSSVSADLAKVATAALNVGAVLAGAMVAGTVAATNKLLALNAELNILSNALNISRESLQLWQIGAESVGISSEKMGDIFKDVNEKLAEFATTGGGEALDLFKRLKLDINELIALSPDQALLKIVGAMDGLKDMSQGEKIFLLESLADDATRLLPLLENNAEMLNKIADRASTNIAIISPEQEDILNRANAKMSEIGSSLDGLATQAGVAGAMIVNAFGDDTTNAIDRIAMAVQDLPSIVEQTSSDMAASWEYATAGGESAFDALKGYAGEYLSYSANLWSSIGDYARIYYTYFPVLARAAFDVVIAYGDAYINDTLALWEMFKASANNAFAALLGYAKSAFVGIANAGGQMVGWLIDKLASFASSAAQAFNFLAAEGVPGFDALASGAESASGRLAGMAESARASGSAVSSAFDSAIASLKASSAEATANAASYKASALAARDAGQAAIKSAGDFIAMKEGQRAINATIREQNQELGGLAKGYDGAGGAAKKFHVDQDAVNKALKDGGGGAKAAKAAKSDLEKQTEKLTKAYDDELKALRLKESELTQTKEEYYKTTLASKDFTAAMLEEAASLHYSNTILEQRRKLTEEANSVKLNPLEQYQEDLKQEGVNPNDIASLATEKQANIQAKISAELEKQYKKATLTTAQYREWELLQEGVTDEFAKRTSQQETHIEQLEKQKELAEDLRDGLTDALMDAAESGFRSFKSLADWLKDTFNNMVLKPIIQSAVGGLLGGIIPGAANASGGGLFDMLLGGAGGTGGGGGIMSSITNLFTGNGIGSAIGNGANMLGMGGLFGNAAGVSNMSYGIAGLAGGLFGNWFGGSNAGIGGSLGATIGTAIMPGIGSIVGGLLGSVVGGLFGGDVTTEGSGVQLSYSGRGGVSGNEYVNQREDGGWFFGDSTWTEYNALGKELTDSLNKSFDDVEKDILAKADALKALGIGAGSDSAQEFMDGFTQGMRSIDLTGKSEEEQKKLLADWFDSVTRNLYTGAIDYGFANAADNTIKRRTGKTTLTTEDRATGYDAIIKEFAAVQTAFDQLGLSVRHLGFGAVNAGKDLETNAYALTRAYTKIAEYSGGIDRFAASAEYYYQNFFSEEERKENTMNAAVKSLDSWNKTLGKAGDAAVDTKEEFRQYIEGLDLATDTGQKAYAEAMKYAGSIITVTGALGAATALLNPTVSCLVAKDIVGELPKYDVGSDYIQTDQTAIIHKGEMIFTANQSASMRDNIVSIMSSLANATTQQAAPAQNNSDLSDKIGQLIAENQAIKQILGAILGDMNLNAADSRGQGERIIGVLNVAKQVGGFKSVIGGGFV